MKREDFERALDKALASGSQPRMGGVRLTEEEKKLAWLVASFTHVGRTPKFISLPTSAEVPPCF